MSLKLIAGGKEVPVTYSRFPAGESFVRIDTKEFPHSPIISGGKCSIMVLLPSSLPSVKS